MTYTCTDPGCDRSFDTKRGRGVHYSHTHGKPTIECDYCGERVERRPSEIERNRYHFCSHQCRADWISENYSRENHAMWQGGPIVVSCSCCGSRFKRKRSEATKDNHNFCDRECYLKYRKENPAEYSQKNRVEVQCHHCGSTYRVIPSRIDQNDRNFCSLECFWEWESEYFAGENGPAWAGGADYYYGPNWPERRDKARERDGYKCQSCGQQDRLEVHHIVHVSEFDDYETANKLENLVTLCKSCHNRWEGIIARPILLQEAVN